MYVGADFQKKNENKTLILNRTLISSFIG